MFLRRNLGALAVVAMGIFAILISLTHSPVPVPRAEEPVASTTADIVPAPAQPTRLAPEYEWHRVVRAVDGDTLVIEIGGELVTIRLIGLDTPETVDPRKAVQCFGIEASEKMKQLVEAGLVRIESDPSQGARDKYGRLLVYAYVPADSRGEDIMLNLHMIAEGYGHEYTYNLPYTYQTEFQKAEQSAREKKKGLWVDDVCAQESAR